MVEVIRIRVLKVQSFQILSYNINIIITITELLSISYLGEHLNIHSINFRYGDLDFPRYTILQLGAEIRPVSNNPAINKTTIATLIGPSFLVI